MRTKLWRLCTIAVLVVGSLGITATPTLAASTANCEDFTAHNYFAGERGHRTAKPQAVKASVSVNVSANHEVCTDTNGLDPNSAASTWIAITGTGSGSIGFSAGRCRPVRPRDGRSPPPNAHRTP